MIVRRTQPAGFVWCRVGGRWCVRGENGAEHLVVGVSRADGTTSLVVLGEEVEPDTYEVAGRPPAAGYRWAMWRGEWCVRGPGGHEGELAGVHSRRTGTDTMVFLYREVEAGLYMFERC